MLCERLVVDQDPVEEFLVVRRHSKGRVFDKRKGDTVGGGKSFAEQKLPICEQPLEEIKGASESSAQQCEPLPVGFRGHDRQARPRSQPLSVSRLAQTNRRRA
jgi:hypothetical protein